jgi:guanylate kinase
MLVGIVVIVVVVSASAGAGDSTIAAHVNDSSSNPSLRISALPRLGSAL